MPRIRVVAILEQLGPKARYALAQALDRLAPEHDIDPAELFDQFVRELDNVSPIWHRVTDHCISPD